MTATKTGTLLRGFIVPIPKEDCTQDLDSSLIPQFVHKIGNHFQLINLLVGNLRRNGVPEAEIDTLQRALDETVEFTRTFLDYSQRPSCMSEFDLGEILLGQMQTMQHAFVEKGITLDNRLDDCFNGALVLGDPALLESALGAVLQNALDATPANGTVTLSGNCGQDRGDSQCSAHVVIADTGCGIEEDLLTRAIEPFYTSRRDRSGLGLSGAFRIAEQHGGRLWICSVAGQGTQVHIMLPIVRTSQTPDR
jgi:signal transduction histidine kinase